ncbi:MAG: SDR family oxidoreductase, partial [Fimbriimonadaceae bacterium]|nr:SDR family oxidoreductase [Alphaproteobacteria bacterium]
EHARHGITLNTVCPGPTETALLDNFMAEAANPEKLAKAFERAVPMGRLGQAEDIPGAILFLASDDAAYVTGQTISVSGGLTMMG